MRFVFNIDNSAGVMVDDFNEKSISNIQTCYLHLFSR